MQLINPSALEGARAYFTGFDNRSYVDKKDDEIKETLCRNLKVLLLTKSFISFGASHLRNKHIQILLQESPYLFEKALLIPALRSDHDGDITKVMSSVDISIQELAKECISKSIIWDLDENAKWFKLKMCEAFENR